jgi:hypothetical protein
MQIRPIRSLATNNKVQDRFGIESASKFHIEDSSNMDEPKSSPAKTIRRPLAGSSARRLKRTALLVGPIFCLALCSLQPADAFLNCLTPNMFKMGRLGHPGGPYAGHPGERANWYPQMSIYGQSYGQNPMR